MNIEDFSYLLHEVPGGTAPIEGREAVMLVNCYGAELGLVGGRVIDLVHKPARFTHVGKADRPAKWLISLQLWTVCPRVRRMQLRRHVHDEEREIADLKKPAAFGLASTRFSISQIRDGGGTVRRLVESVLSGAATNSMPKWRPPSTIWTRSAAGPPNTGALSMGSSSVLRPPCFGSRPSCRHSPSSGRQADD